MAVAGGSGSGVGVGVGSGGDSPECVSTGTGMLDAVLRGAPTAMAGPVRLPVGASEARRGGAGRRRGGRVRFVVRRAGLSAATLVAAVTLDFLLPRMMPGDPLASELLRLGGRASPGTIRVLQNAFGVHAGQGLAGQYVAFWAQLLHGNLGISITYFPSSVSAVIAQSLPWSVCLVGVATVLSFGLGTALGVVAAWRRGTWFDAVVPATGLLASVPYFWTGLLVLTVFAAGLHWFPLSGGSSVTTAIGWNWPFVASAVDHAILPAATIVASSVGVWLLGMRNMMVASMAEDHVLLAEAKGLPTRRVLLAYAARTAVLSNVASLAVSLGFVVGGAVLTEIVFSYPGIGFVLFNAVSNDDLPLMQGVFLVITVAVLAANLIADAVYAVLDPRIAQAS